MKCLWRWVALTSLTYVSFALRHNSSNRTSATVEAEDELHSFGHGPQAKTDRKLLTDKMDADKKLPSQGFDGPSVRSDDISKDWRKEYGPKAGDGKGEWTFEDICAKHPRNKWCIKHGYVSSNTSSRNGNGMGGSGGVDGTGGVDGDAVGGSSKDGRSSAFQRTLPNLFLMSSCLAALALEVWL